jgi:hypothetical protein
MATKLRTKLETLQINLLCDEYDGGGSRVTATKGAIEGIVDALEKELSPFIYLVGYQSVIPKRFNTATREWIHFGGLIFNAGSHYVAAKALSNGHLVAIRSDCRYVEIDPLNRRDYRQLEYFGKRFSGDTHDLDIRHDDRPDIYGIVHLEGDVFGMFDTVLFKTYIEIDLLSGQILKMEENDFYESDEEDEESDASRTRRRLRHTFGDYYDVGGGKCLLVVGLSYFIVDVPSHQYEEIPNPYPGEGETYGDKYIGMSDGSIFTVGNTGRVEGQGFVTTARCSRFDLATKTWMRLADAPIAIESNACILMPDGDIMVLANENPTDKMLIYNPPTNTWTMTDSPFDAGYDELHLVLV